MFNEIKSLFVHRKQEEKEDKDVLGVPNVPGIPSVPGVPDISLPTFEEREKKEEKEVSVICVANRKGGCGKTTTAINLAAALSKSGFKVLLIDLDSQAHASLGVGINVDEVTHSIYDVLVKNVDMERAILKTSCEGLNLVPATSMLSGAQLEIADLLGREGILRNALFKMINTRRQSYDYVVIDCSPSLNLLTINGMVASSHVLIPVQTHYFALEGMRELFSTIEIIKGRLNSELQILGILPTLYNRRTRMDRGISSQLKSYFGNKVFQSTIRVNITLAEASASRQSIFDFAPNSKGAKDYASLTEEVVALTRAKLKN